MPILEASYAAFYCMLQFIYGSAAATDVGKELAPINLTLALSPTLTLPPTRTPTLTRTLTRTRPR